MPVRIQQNKQWWVVRGDGINLLPRLKNSSGEYEPVGDSARRYLKDETAEIGAPNGNVILYQNGEPFAVLDVGTESEVRSRWSEIRVAAPGPFI